MRAVGIGHFFILLIVASNLGAAKSIRRRSQVSVLLINTYINSKNIDFAQVASNKGATPLSDIDQHLYLRKCG